MTFKDYSTEKHDNITVWSVSGEVHNVNGVTYFFIKDIDNKSNDEILAELKKHFKDKEIYALTDWTVI